MSSFLRLAAGALLLAASPLLAPPAPIRLAVRNALTAARPGETVVVALPSLPGVNAGDLPGLAVVDPVSGKALLAQPLDGDGDGAFDQLVFQADFASGQTRGFELRTGQRQPPRRDDFRVYGRFVRERFDDFAWENDRVAHRMYGPALESWTKEPLTSSGVDVWCKRTRRLVVNDWYLVDDYHRDTGEGADLYSVGKSRGCGGSGVFRDGRLHTSRNFRASRVLANGPIRLVFELVYEAWDAGGLKVSETKRVTLDAGSHLNRFESTYTPADVPWAAGIKKAPNASLRTDRARGLLRTWETLKEGNGSLGCAVVLDPAQLQDFAEADGNALALGRGAADYWAGSGWDKGGDVADAAAWDRYLDDFSSRLRSPLDVVVSRP